MKTLFAATVAFVAFAAPSLALAGQQLRYDPAENEFVAATQVTGTAPTADTARYTQEATVWDPSEGEFTTIKVGSTPVIGTHDAAPANTVVKRVWDPSEGEFTEVTVGN